MRHHIGRSSSDRDLLRLCAAGDATAIDLLIDRHVVPAVPMARELAGPRASADQVLDAVHDAFVTAFDESLDGDVESPAPLFKRLLSEFAAAVAAAPSAWDAGMTVAITDDDELQLRRDVSSELRLTVELRAEAPGPWWRGQFFNRLSRIRREPRLPIAFRALGGELRIKVR